MTRRTTTIAAVAVVSLIAAWPAGAQIFWPLVVYDPAVEVRNRIVAIIHEQEVALHGALRRQIENMARRLSALAHLGRYVIHDTPEWRIHDFWSEDVLFAHDYHAALNYGDAHGAAYTAVVAPLLTIDDEREPIGSEASAVLRARLATIQAADALTIAATNDAGLLRYNGRRDQAAIELLEWQITDPSGERSTTAALDTLSAASLIAARQRQARIAFVADIVLQLVLDTKRARDAAASALNMQLTTWREAELANRALAAGTGEALRTWRQP